MLPMVFLFDSHDPESIQHINNYLLLRIILQSARWPLSRHCKVLWQFPDNLRHSTTTTTTTTATATTTTTTTTTTTYNYNNKCQDLGDTHSATLYYYYYYCYCNASLYGVSDRLMRRLQSVQNAAARLVTGVPRCAHITPILQQLHWLPVRQRILFKMAVLVFQCLAFQAPSYLSDDC